MPDRKAVENAAKASWITVLLPVGLRLALGREQGEAAVPLAYLALAFTLLCYVIGIGAGVYALSKVKAVGRDGVLTPAIVGTTLCSALLLFTLLVLTRVVRL